uniref:protein-serine/threonine phosphatase n=1 Tax=Aegilops tauschii subsp. strangulata TaxID=200361 RepID=A0A452ZP93_AEGTS
LPPPSSPYSSLPPPRTPPPPPACVFGCGSLLPSWASRLPLFLFRFGSPGSLASAEMAAAAAICGQDEPAPRDPEGAAAAAGGGVERLDLGDGRAALVAGGKRSVYLMECEPVWGCVATPGRGGEMEDACAAVPRFADVPVRLLARRRDLDGLGLDADALRLPSHLFAVFDGHGGAEVCTPGAGTPLLSDSSPTAAPQPSEPRDLTICGFPCRRAGVQLLPGEAPRRAEQGAEEAPQRSGRDERCGHEGALGRPLHQVLPDGG